MIRTIASALAALALISFGARAEDTKPADSAATTMDKKADKVSKKARKKGKKAKKAASDAKTDVTTPAK